MPRTDHVLALLLAAVTAATRIPFRARLLPTWDAVQFALALSEYDIVRHQPHPPGYILYVGLGRLLDTILSDAAASLTWLAITASAITVFVAYRLAWTLYGRPTALVAATGLAASPLFWFYGLVPLPYAVEAALALTVATLAWPMRSGRASYALWSALALGLAGGVRQSLLVLLFPLWLWAAWRGLRRPAPVLAGLAVLGLTVAGWLAPMLWLAGGSGRYLWAVRELYESTVRATSIVGGPWGWTANVRGLAEALLVGFGLLLPALVQGIAQGVRRMPAWTAREWFFAVWIVPPLAVYTGVHFGQYGYLLTALPAGYILAARWLCGALAGRPVRLAGLVGALALLHAAYFIGAGPVDVPRPAGPASPAADHGANWARAFYRFRLWALTAGGLREQEHVIAVYVDAVRQEFRPAEAVLVTELGNPRSYPWFRHVTYYLPEFAVYHLRLGRFSRGYLAGPRPPTMAAVERTEILLPAGTRRLVWVVDHWNPAFPRPAGLRERPVPYGRWLYVVDLDGRPVEHDGYRLSLPTG